MNTECAICLSDIDKNHIIKKLSCGHCFHYRCFTRIVFRNENMYILCPLCRKINIDVTKPLNDAKRNIQLLCSQKVGKERCICTTKKGTLCKNKSRILNYGMCYQHNKEILHTDMYPLMVTYMMMILSQRSKWSKKIIYFDIGKKLLIHRFNKDSAIEELMNCFYEYFSVNKNHTLMEIYDYYQFKKPSDEWLNYCSEKHILI